MANLIIPPRDLPPAAEVFPTDALVVDNGASVGKATPQQIVDAGRPWASIEQAQAGTDSGVSMTPLTTRAAVDARIGTAVSNATQQLRAFPSYAAALAGVGSLPVDILVVSADVDGREVRWVRQSGGPCLGGGWAPAGTPTFLHYGATGAGLVDETAAMQTALDAHPTEHVDGLGLPYRVFGTLTGARIKNIKLRKVGAGSVFRAWGSTEDPVVPGVGFVRGATSIVSGALAPLLSEGEWFAVISENDPFSGFMAGTSGGRSGEIVQVASISGSTINITAALFWQYLTDQRAVKVNWLKGVSLVDVDIEGDPTANPGTFGGGGELIDLRFCLRPVLKNVVGYKNKMAVVMLHCCVGASITDGGARDLGSELSIGDGLGNGYGVLERGMNVGAVISGNFWTRLRTGYTTGAGLPAVWRYGMPTGTLVTGNYSGHTKQSGMSTHEAGLHQSFIGNHIECTGSMGINLRAKFGVIKGNHIVRTQGPAVSLINNGVDAIAEGCIVDGNTFEYTNLGFNPEGLDQRQLGAVEDRTADAIIKGNVIRKCGGPAWRGDFTLRSVFENNTVIDPCQFVGVHGVNYAAGSAAAAGAGTPWWVVKGNTFISNDGLCTVAFRKPNSLFAKGAGNTVQGIPSSYQGEDGNVDMSFSGSGAVSFGARDISEQLSGDTLALNALTVTSATITVQAETAGVDDLVNITGGFDGQRIVLRAVSGNTITVKNSGNVRTGTGTDLIMTYGAGIERLHEFQRSSGVWVKVT